MCGAQAEISLSEFLRRADEKIDNGGIFPRFIELVKPQKQSSVKPVLLDIGGRPRSGNEYISLFPDFDAKVLDVHAADGVDIVCDAHEMSLYIEPESVDAVLCVSVFEHILMPWKLVLEINKVLKLNSYCFIHSHQTIGMHDLPWDFWRFSDQAWHALFNEYTGFQVVATHMGGFGTIIPSVYAERYQDREKAGGYESSSVIVRKISNSQLEWNVDLSAVINTMYPDDCVG
jgi:hypothetical protein